MGPIFDGLKLMVMGMGYVVVFLVVMICCMKIMGKLLEPIAACLDKAPAAPKRPAPVANDDALRAAAAVAALNAHKNGK